MGKDVSSPSHWQAALTLVASVLICLSAGFFGNLLSFDSNRTWYPSIAKPSWTPPSWVFGPVWSTLYATMGVSAWRVFRLRESKEARKALLVFGVHLVLNAGWSALFFGLRRPDLAFVEIMLLLTMIIVVVVMFSRRDRLAGALLLPYLLWTTFATVLNGTIVAMNW